MYKTSNYLKTANKQGGGKLYFISPVEFNIKSVKTLSQNSNYNHDRNDFLFKPDFTYNYYKDSVNKKVVMNFFINASKPIESIDSILLRKADSPIYKATNFEQFFIEKQGRNEWENRYSTDIPFPEFMFMLNSGKALNGEIYLQGSMIRFEAPNKWKYCKESVYPTMKYELDYKPAQK